MAKILIIEDEPKIAEAIQAYLKNSGHETHIELNGRSGQQAFLDVHFDLIVLDLMLPDINGEDICHFIRSRSRIPIIMLTAKVSEISQLQGFRIGADDYITKPFSPRVLMVRIEALLRRYKEEPTARLFSFKNGELEVDTKKRNIIKNGNEVHLTPIEFDLLEKLLSFPGRAFTREEIIQTVMGTDYDGTDRTIDSHIRNLRSKLEENPKQPEYIITSRGRGFYFNEK